jgi:glycerol-3-phosphate dehydrogenase (NAD(P)+)
MKKKEIAVIGGGSWATALAKLILQNKNRIHWFLRNPDNIAFLKKYHHNPNYLSSIRFDANKIVFHDNLKEAVSQGEILIFAIPSAFLHHMLTREPLDLQGKCVFSVIKGMVPEYNLIMADYFNRIHHVDLDYYGTITGPSHSEEVALERLTYLTLACRNEERAKQMAELFHCHYIKTTISDDIYGTEYAAVMKNIFALACGIAHGLGYGDNFLAVLVANAAQEMKRFIDTVCPTHRDINTSAYLGDLVVTAYSQFSRNRVFGTMIGKGYSIPAAQVELNMIAEGFYAVKPMIEINKNFKVEIPIIQAVYNILYEKISPAIELRLLSEIIS